MAVVYDAKTGEPFECESVDAKELVESKAYTKEPQKKEPAKRGPKPKAEKQDAEEKAE